VKLILESDDVAHLAAARMALKGSCCDPGLDRVVNPTLYAALSHYHAHKDDLDAAIKAEAELASELEEKVSAPFKALLKELDAKVVRYHLDRSCPTSLAHELRARGIDVTTTPEVWLRNTTDGEPLSYATVAAASC
jgi:hypothetical protein